MPREPSHQPDLPGRRHAPAKSAAPSIIPLERADPGWLFLIAGLALAAATVLIPAQQDLADVRWLRDRAVLIEQHRQHRLNNYARYIAAAERGDETVVLQLVESQLGMRPANRAPLLIEPWNEWGGGEPAMVFAALEPPTIVEPERPQQESRLGRWSTDERTRLWMLGGAGLLVLIGLMPPGRRTLVE